MPEKLKKKEIKTRLVNSIEDSLLELNYDKMIIKKMRKFIVKNAEKIASKLTKDKKKETIEEPQSETIKVKYPTSTNKKFLKGLKQKPTQENIKEVIKI